MARLAERESANQTDTLPRSTPAAGTTRSGAADALLQYRALADAQRLADDERAQVVDHLLKALAASEVADGHRRAALTVAEALLGQFITPDDAAGAQASSRMRERA